VSFCRYRVIVFRLTNKNINNRFRFRHIGHWGNGCWPPDTQTNKQTPIHSNIQSQKLENAFIKAFIWLLMKRSVSETSDTHLHKSTDFGVIVAHTTLHDFQEDSHFFKANFIAIIRVRTPKRNHNDVSFKIKRMHHTTSKHPKSFSAVICVWRLSSHQNAVGSWRSHNEARTIV